MTTMTEQVKLRVKIAHDHDTQSPNSEGPGEDGEWTIISFSNRHINYEDPYNYFNFDNGSLNPITDELKQKLENGHAHLLDYFEHGLGKWSRHGHGPQCQWDNAQYAGLLVWNHKPEDMGATTYEDRAKDADNFLERYSDWCNGNCYGYIITKINHCDSCGQEHDSEELDSCWGFIGDDIEHGIAEALNYILKDYPDAEIEYTGDGAFHGDYVELNRDTN